MTTVYAWPPVAVSGMEWTEEAPVSVSRSLITGKRFASATKRKRRKATVIVQALDNVNRSGAGYVEVLKRLLAGGENYVRLYSYPINWHIDSTVDQYRRYAPIGWTFGGGPLDWTAGGLDLTWFVGEQRLGTLTTDGGFPAVRVTGFPANALVARAGDFVTSYAESDAAASNAAQAVRDTYANGSGVAVIRLLEPLAYAGFIDIGGSANGIFEADAMPRAVQPLGQNWSYTWNFSEVFADEIGAYDEVNPWR